MAKYNITNPRPLPINIIQDNIILQAKYWLDVNKKSDEECWNWVGVFTGGYYKDGTRNPIFCIDNQSYIATRVGYFIQANIDPEKNLVLHTCNNHICQNIKHLYLGTQSDNTLDTIKIGREYKYRGCRLNHDQVRDIRRMYYEESYTMIQLATIFNTSRQHIWRVINKKHWEEIE